MSDNVETPEAEAEGKPAGSVADLVDALRGEADDEPADVDAPAQEGGRTEADEEAYADGGVNLESQLPMDPDDDLDGVEDGEVSERLVSIVESVLFAAKKPLRVKDLRRILKEPTKRQIQRAVKRILADYGKRGVVLNQVAGGFRFGTHPENAAWVQRLMSGKPARLSRSQLEALAVVAYRQPITKAEVDHVRGVDCSAVLRLLLERDLVKIVGRKEEPGRPHLYGTTVRFLEFFNLKNLRDLPDLREFRELTEDSKATLRERLGDEDEVEIMGQETLEFEEDEAVSDDDALDEDVPDEGDAAATEEE